MRLSSESIGELGELISLVSDPRVRYKAYTFQTADVRLTAEIARLVQHQFGGAILDVLQESPLASGSIAVSAGDLVDWVARTIVDPRPHCLLHVDAALSLWQSPAEHRVWWTQVALIEATGALMVFTARSELAGVELWGRVGELRLANHVVQLWAPRRSSHFQSLTQADLLAQI